MSKVNLYNTLTRKKEQFKPIGKEVKMYSCGPTVYSYQHIGNLRSYVLADLLKRTLIYNEYKVKHVINVTDVGHLTSDADSGEDKMEKAAEREGKKAEDIARFYFKEFEKDLKKMNILSPWKWAWATKHVKEQIELVKKLEKKGFTYKTRDGIYFDSKKFKGYGKLAKLNIKELRAGKRVEIGEKKNKTDFALWKFSSNPGERQQEWKSPWGIGFPGWHLECSAMSMKYLGNHFDIHTGGEDHISVHHTNEIAQSEALTGKKFVNYWIHGAFLMNKGKKISKSTGGLYTISDLEKEGYSPMHLRYLFFLTNYRKQLNFSLDILDAARNAYERLKKKIVELKKERHKGTDRTKDYENEFINAINDNLNTSRAIDVLWKVINDFDFEHGKKLKLLEKFDCIFGFGIKNMKEEKIGVPAEIKRLLEERERLRKEKKFAEADILRERIFEMGFKVEDSEKGVIVEKN
ncbi:cysteine--tRNA ligase [Candidatus Pacearchaeota archaeon CG1_02_32_132]|nr:MAG: cysteine--tRNA ligase [Candidatus Pacearchaeota archaeon CG1_02_32_132]